LPHIIAAQNREEDKRPSDLFYKKREKGKKKWVNNFGWTNFGKKIWTNLGRGDKLQHNWDGRGDKQKNWCVY
jgi:hypothetical protein